MEVGCIMNFGAEGASTTGVKIDSSVNGTVAMALDFKITSGADGIGSNGVSGGIVRAGSGTSLAGSMMPGDMG